MKKFRAIPNKLAIYFVELSVDKGLYSYDEYTKNMVSFWAKDIQDLKEKIKRFIPNKIRQIIIWDSKLYLGSKGVDKVIVNYMYNYNSNKLMPIEFPGIFESKIINKHPEMHGVMKFISHITEA